MILNYHTNIKLEKRKDKNSGTIITSNVPINFEITFNGLFLKYYSGYRIDKDLWDEENQKVNRNCFNKNGTTASDINGRLNQIEEAINRTFKYYIGIEKKPSLSDIRNGIRERLNETKTEDFDLFTKYDEYIKGAKVTEGRRKQIKTTKNHFSRYCELNRLNIKFDNIPDNLAASFREYLYKDENKGKGRNTVVNNLKRLKSFFNFALHKGWIKTDPFESFSIEQEIYGTPIFLTNEELTKLIQVEINDQQMSLMRDLFVFQCHFGGRVGDFFSLRRENIIDDFIHYIPSKTINDNIEPIKVPLTQTAKQLLKKYDFPEGQLFPFPSSQEYNRKLKELLPIAEIDRTVVHLNSITSKPEIVSIASIASSHMARRTFIGNLHKTIKNEVIASMSGHVENSKAFARYYEVDDTDKKNALKIFE